MENSANRKIRKIQRDLKALHKLISDGEKLRDRVIETKEGYMFQILTIKANTHHKVLGLVERREIKETIADTNKRIKKLDKLLKEIEKTKAGYEERCKMLQSVLNAYIKEDSYDIK